MKLYFKIILVVMLNNILCANSFSADVSLSIEEKNYLASKKIINMCIDPDWMPLEKIDHGKHVGLSADFMQQISQKLKIPFKLIETKTWAESLDKIKNKECDILALTEKTPLRQKYLNFTTAYLTLPLVVATKIGEPFSDSFDSIMDEKLGIVKNYSQNELLKNKYPDIRLIEFDSMKEGLDHVNQEKIYGFLDNAMVLNHAIQTVHMMENITISGQFKEKNYLSIGSRNDEPLLNDILEKTLSSLDESTKNAFISKWSSIRYETNTDYTLLVQMLFLGLVILSIFIYWNLLLKEEIKKKEIAQKLLQEKKEQLRIAKEELETLNNSLEKRIETEVKENTKNQALIMHQSKLVQMGEMIENIAHQWRQPLAQINSSVLLIDAMLLKNQFENKMVEDKLLEIESLTSYMSNTIDDFKNFFDPDKKKTLFSIKHAIEKAYDILKGSIQSHHIEVTIVIEDELKVYGYLEELQQVFLTLLNNAIDALVLMKIVNAKIKICAYKEKNSVIVEVQDNALGIEKKCINKVFEPYFTTKHKSQGTGLGLYMAKMIIENALAGTLNVENKFGGACFTLIVPIEENKNES